MNKLRRRVKVIVGAFLFVTALSFSSNIHASAACSQHHYDSGVITTYPTIYSNGARTYTCTSCGKKNIQAEPAYHLNLYSGKQKIRKVAFGKNLLLQNTHIDADKLSFVTKENVYKISYDLNGGTLNNEPLQFSKSLPAVKIPKPTRPGFTFAGWTGTGITVPACDVKIDPSHHGDIKLVAKWKAPKVNMQLKWNNGAVTGSHGNDGRYPYLTGLRLWITDQESVPGGITYYYSIESPWRGVRWSDMDYQSNGNWVYDTGSRALYAVKIELNGDIAKYWNITYEVHFQGINNQYFGSNGQIIQYSGRPIDNLAVNYRKPGLTYKGGTTGTYDDYGNKTQASAIIK